MKLRRTLALMTALAALAGSTLTVTAQETKPKNEAKTQDKKKDDKKKDKESKDGKIEIYEGKSGWRFRVKNSDDKTVAMATKGYESKDAVIKELDFIKETLNKAKPTEVKEKD